MTMLVLTGKNLGERQRELNRNVNDAAKNKIDFTNVKHQTEKSDVDKLFKIDLAVKYKNIEYILEIIKCGDNMYISRALEKCFWLYDKDFIHIVNTDYFSDHIFPFMSMKMRNKALITVATHLKNEERAIDFYKYCMKMKLHNIALKFLIHTPECFKFEVIVERSKAFNLIQQKEGNYLEYLIGNSFVLAESYIKNMNYHSQKSNAIYLLRYMYSVSNDKYLNMLETCDENPKVFGRRLSKHIIQSHKSRVMEKPVLYANVLNRSIISRNSTIDDAKTFAIALLPEKSSQFFAKPYHTDSDYYTSNKFVLDLIPEEEKFSFIKKIFTEKYPGQAFETCSEFYHSNLYNIMTAQERETWALHNIASQNEILGSGNDYLWYKFVNFEKASIELKKLIIKTTDKNKRCEMLKVLIDCAKTEDELTKLLNYYGERHRNEVAFVTDQFLDKLISDHKVWRFGDVCWMALENIFYSANVFDKLKYMNSASDCRILTLMYYALKGEPVPEILNKYLDKEFMSFYVMKTYLKNLRPETEIIINYIMQFYNKKIEALSAVPYEDDTKEIIKRYIRSVLDLLRIYDRKKEDLPEIMQTYIKLDWSAYKHHMLLADSDTLSSNDIIHHLKKDAKLVVIQFSKIKDYVESSAGNINWLIHKLKVYFAHDISKEYLHLFSDCLSAESLQQSTANVAVRGILTLSEWTSKIDFLENYAPKDKKIDLAKMHTNTFYIQKAICKQMHCSRPPLPLSNIFQFVIGDYVQYCFGLFRWYLLNLPYLKCLEFVESMIDKPVSIQKHGLRLAFECFDEEKLKIVILDSWKKTKNVSLRMILFKSLYKKILNENHDTQIQLFEILIIMTLDLNEDDDEAFQLIRSSDLPDHLGGRYLESVWKSVSKFSEKPQNFGRMVKILQDFESNISLLAEDCVLEIVDSHVRHMLDEGQILKTTLNQGFDDLLKVKWLLTISHLVYVTNEKKLQKNLELVKHIIKQCIAMWDKRNESNVYVIRQFLRGFIKDLDIKSHHQHEKSYSNVVIILQLIEHDLKKALPEKEIYMLVWNLRSSVITKKVILETKLMEDIDEQRTETKRSGILLGNKFGSLIKTNVDEGKFYVMFYEQIENVVSTVIENYIKAISIKYKNKLDSCLQHSSTDLYILFCLGLLEHHIPETYMFALRLLPLNYEENSTYFEDYVNIIKKIQNFQNAETQCYMFEKFINTDFKQRYYIS